MKVFSTAAIFLPLLLCSCVAVDSFQVYDTIFRNPWYQNMNPKHVKFWYYGSTETSDYFMLVRQKIKLDKKHTEKGLPPFLSDEERFEFDGWEVDKRKRLLWTLIQVEGKAQLVLKLPQDPTTAEDVFDMFEHSRVLRNNIPEQMGTQTESTP